jgi:uncharacterized protein
MSLADEKYIATSTYRKSGLAVTTTTWVVALDGGRFGFLTSSATGKTKRLRNSDRITVVPSDARGRVKPGAAAVEGTAVLVTSGPDFDAVHSRVRAKYGFAVPMSRFFNALSHLGRGKLPYGDVVVVVTPAPSPPAD